MVWEAQIQGNCGKPIHGGLSVYSDSIHLNLKNPAPYAGTNLAFYNNESRQLNFQLAQILPTTLRQPLLLTI